MIEIDTWCVTPMDFSRVVSGLYSMGYVVSEGLRALHPNTEFLQTLTAELAIRPDLKQFKVFMRPKEYHLTPDWYGRIILRIYS